MGFDIKDAAGVTKTFATDTVAGVEHEIQKVAFGAAGTATLVTPTSALPVDIKTVGQQAKAASLSVALASNDDSFALTGPVTEAAPASDTASSGLNGRLQRIAQRLTSLIALLPTTIGQKAKAGSLSVSLASDDDSLTLTGPVTEAAPASDTASSGLNGRLQRIAQRLTSLIALLPTTIGQKAKAASLSVSLASDDDLLAKIGEVQASPTANTVLDRLKQLLTTAQAATPAGENHIGAVGGNSAVVGGTIVRPATTITYSSGQLIANAAAAGSVTPLVIPVARVNAGTGAVRGLRVSTNQTGLAGTEIVRVHLFKNSPTVANGDGGTFSANGIASIGLGQYDVVLNNVYNDGSKGFVPLDRIFDAAAGSPNIYGLLEARSTIAGVSGATWTVVAETSQD